MSLLAHELRMQQLLFWRNREAAVFVFVFPPMLFLLLGSVYDGKIDGYPAAAVLMVGILGYGCANTALAGLAIQLVVRRESGLLKRVRATPLPAATYLSGVLGVPRRYAVEPPGTAGYSVAGSIFVIVFALGFLVLLAEFLQLALAARARAGAGSSGSAPPCN